MLEIVKYPNPILKKRAKRVKRVDQEINSLAKDMVEAMLKYDGVGLAAPQVGISKRIIVVQGKDEPVVYINPRVICKSLKKEEFEEGCLSFPDLYLNIKRSVRVTLVATLLNGEKVKVKASGIIARVFLHEIDHLNGVLFISRIPLLEKLKNLFKKNVG